MTIPEMTGRQRFLAAANLQPVDTTPVWFMRQAGRCLPEYRALRKQHSFMELAHTPELAVQATLMPVDRFDVDGAVLFADIMLPLEGMGVEFEIKPGVGPVIANPIRTMADVEALRVVGPEEGTPYVLEALRLLRSELGDRAAALGFAGAPWTLACYLVDGKPTKEYPKTKAMMYGQPDVWHALMEKLTQVTELYVQGQVEAGADVVQLFDSWLGLVDEDNYRTHVQPYTARIFAFLRGKAPTIHFSTGTNHLLTAIRDAQPNMVSVDWRVRLAAAWEIIGHDKGIQGNLDPTLLFAPWPTIASAATDILQQAGGRHGHIFNLGHGIHPETDPDKLLRLTQFVHNSGD
ncbi:MAG: uroporphyrinogen decarboxylase [Thermomicrobiales bacterium]|nr:uroporphyrinogen decarboxylase [Thermomicrobiales bacterium]MCO5225539.1 uroporphyrinogen decarboxylase [Thermomicrobiales bacterium]MCO5228177.1 uroporphyrinogen decarboxylase [Thermomicrobiales bacterium]